MLETDTLTAPERALWLAFPRGEWVDLGDAPPDGWESFDRQGQEPSHEQGHGPSQDSQGADGPTDATAAASDRTIRAEVIATLLLGAEDPAPGHVPAVRLSGALITGRLDVAGGSLDYFLHLTKCRLTEAPGFTETRVRTIRITDCHLPGFNGRGLRTEGYLSLTGSTIDGPVRVPSAHLTGGLRLNGTRIRHPRDCALLASALTVEKSGVLARNLEVSGGIRLMGAQLGGGFFLEGAHLSNPQGEAMTGDNMIVEDAMECSRGFTAHGTLRLRGARINGTLSFHKGALHSPTQALHASHMRIEEFIFTPRQQVQGEVNLGYTAVGVMIDRFDAWPDTVRLDGFTYDTLRDPSSRDQRLAWVSCHPDGYRPQPYEQLAAWYRRLGHDDNARRVMLAKQRHRRSTLHPARRVFGYLLDGTVGYGYRPALAGLWLLLLIVAGTATFAALPPVYIGDGLPPPLNPFIYTLDLLIPIGAFGLRDVYAAAGGTQWLAYGLIAAGWILATALIAAATRVLHRP